MQPKSVRWLDVDRSVDELCITVLGLSIAIFDEENGMDFFMKHYNGGKPETKLYVALHRIDAFGGTPSFWIKVYEDGVRRGIKPRTALIAEYEEHKKKL